ncbi:MAG: cyclic nucleotide-binding domain-containing protein [Opitutaceae bacterium]
MKTVKIPAGRLVFAKGDDGDDAYRVIEGTVEIFIGNDKSKVVLAQLRPGEVFGEMGMIDCRPRSASARAIGDITLEVISRDNFNDSLLGSGTDLMPYLSAIFERLRVTNERLHDALLELKGDSASVDAEQILQEQVGPKLRLMPDSEEMRGQSALQERELDAFPFLIGRRGDIAGTEVVMKNQVLIADRLPFRVSRNHCYIERYRDGFVVRDRSSRRGTLVNGVLIGSKSREKSLRLKEGVNSLVIGGSDSACRFKLIVSS